MVAMPPWQTATDDRSMQAPSPSLSMPQSHHEKDCPISSVKLLHCPPWSSQFIDREPSQVAAKPSSQSATTHICGSHSTSQGQSGEQSKSTSQRHAQSWGQTLPVSDASQNPSPQTTDLPASMPGSGGGGIVPPSSPQAETVARAATANNTYFIIISLCFSLMSQRTQLGFVQLRREHRSQHLDPHSTESPWFQGFGRASYGTGALLFRFY